MSRLGDRLRAHARDAGDAPAVYAGDRWWSFGELVAAGDRLALGVGPGDVVAIAIDRGIEAVIALAATALAGAIPALLDPRDRELAARTLAALRPAAVVVGPDDDRLPGARVIELRDGELAGPAAPAGALGWQPISRPPSIAHIIFTSGSTAQGKGVVWSELRARFDWMINRPRRASRGRPSGIVVPLCTALGFHQLAGALVHRTTVALIDAPFPAAIGQLRSLGVDRVKLTPTHVELLLATAEELPGLRVVAVAAAPIAPDRLRALADRLPAARICRSYGLTESGAATMVWLHKRRGKLHSVGRAIGYRRITVRDEHGRMLPPGRPGEVVIEMPVWDAVDGYLDAPPELARRFDNGVLWTGDRGTIDRHGYLVLGSRTAEILKVGGRSVGAPRIEEQLAALPGIAEVAVVGVPDRVLGEVPCAVFVPAPGCDARRLVDGGATGGLLPDERPRWLFARRALPRGPSGKLRRGVLAGEAARWTRTFAQRFAPEHRPYPAFDLEHGVAVVDGCPPAWLGDVGPLDPTARLIALVAREPARPLALALVQAGAPGLDGGVRFVVGPAPAELVRGQITEQLLDVFAGELVVLAGVLPGPRARAVCAFPGGPRRALAGAGFAPIAGAAGWLARSQPGEPSEPIAGESLAEPLAELAAAAGRLAGWARACAAAAADQRRSAGSD